MSLSSLSFTISCPCDLCSHSSCVCPLWFLHCPSIPSVFFVLAIPPLNHHFLLQCQYPSSSLMRAQDQLSVTISFFSHSFFHNTVSSFISPPFMHTNELVCDMFFLYHYVFSVWYLCCSVASNSVKGMIDILLVHWRLQIPPNRAKKRSTDLSII